MRCLFVGIILLGGLWSTANVRGDDPLPPPRPLPGPRPVPVEVWPPVYYPSVYTRRSAYEVWQYYAVDKQGHWRPRVVYEPGGMAYYLYNGKPYPWASVHQHYFTPTIQGTPYRTYMPYAHD
jgi:hypothetical protein